MKWGKGSHVINKLMAHCLPKVGGYTTAPGKNILMYPDCHLAVTNYIICPHVAVLKLIRPYNFAKSRTKSILSCITALHRLDKPNPRGAAWIYRNID